MKILFKDDVYDKVSNDLEADQKVRKYGWRYVSKKEWKENVRDVKKVEEEAKAKEITEKKKNANNTNRTKTKV